MDISGSLHTIDIENEMTTIADQIGLDDIEDELPPIQTSSFMPKLPIKQRELDSLKMELNLQDVAEDTIYWPNIDSSPINEYNTKGLLDLAFPTLFPNGVALPLQPRIRRVYMHEYAVHLIKYQDQRFGRHPRF